MSAVTTRVLDHPELAAAETAAPGDDPFHHLYCCDDNIALCGLNVSGYEDDPDSEETVCPLCALAEDEGLPCPVPGCKG